jgi:hypothetical protein
MYPHWQHFHSAFEALAALNVALFTFPGLRHPVITGEAKRWNSLRRSVKIDNPAYVSVAEAAILFSKTRVALEEEYDTVRRFCLAAGVLATAMLLVATGLAEDEAQPVVAWGTVGIAILPAIILYGKNRGAQARLGALSVLRLSLQNKADEAVIGE